MVSCSQELTPPDVAEDPDVVVNDTIPDDDGNSGEGDGGGDDGSGGDPGDGNGDGSGGEGAGEDVIYFPPQGEDTWLTVDPDSLAWNTAAINDLLNFLDNNKTRAFLVLHRGRLVIEHYNGAEFNSSIPFTGDSEWYWASAGKTLTAFLAGIAKEQGLLDLSAPTSNYLGESWSSVSPEKQQLISVRNHLTMTTGLDEKVKDDTPNDNVDDDCTDPECLQYKADAGSRWSYHNAPYNLLDDIIDSASGIRYESFSLNNLEAPIGMEGEWRIQEEYNKIYWSSARDAARFGLLMLNGGVWNTTPLLEDTDYFNTMISTSQEINPAYGYLWWLNKEGAVLPGSGGQSADIFTANAPGQMFTAAGLNGQFINVIPELELVVVRFGELNGTNLKTLHNTMWGYLKTVIQY
ncbi:class C beta-lactamase-related serine hydrolase [Robertkochia marina]|nr:class C beta-lactamase-related serine hydrolase [Robertkochia marina]